MGLITINEIYSIEFSNKLKTINNLKQKRGRYKILMNARLSELSHRREWFSSNLIGMSIGQLNAKIRACEEVNIRFSEKADKAVLAEVTKTINEASKYAINHKVYDEAVNKYSSTYIDKKLFKFILESFCFEMMENLCKGKSWSLGYGLGALEVVKKERFKPAINWGDSTKKKEEIIARGGTPFEVTHRLTDGTIVKHNNGEPWFVYFTEDFCWLIWNKKYSSLENIRYYSIAPVYTMMNNIVEVANSPSKSSQLRYIEIKTDSNREESRKKINQVSHIKD